MHRVYGGDRGRVADARPCLLRDGARRQGTSRAACLMTAPRTACLLTLRRVTRSCRASCRHRSSHVRRLHPPPRLRHKQNLPRLQQAASGGLSSPFSAYLVSTSCKQHCRCLAESGKRACCACIRACVHACACVRASSVLFCAQTSLVLARMLTARAVPQEWSRHELATSQDT